MKEKLVELLRQCVMQNVTTDPDCWDAIIDVDYGKMADSLLESGVIVLPCKVGDTVYVIPSKTNRKLNILSRKPELNRVYEQKICRFEFYERGVFLAVTCDGIEYVHSAFFGENWFLTRGEAEAALKEVQ